MVVIEWPREYPNFSTVVYKAGKQFQFVLDPRNSYQVLVLIVGAKRWKISESKTRLDLNLRALGNRGYEGGPILGEG